MIRTETQLEQQPRTITGGVTNEITDGLQALMSRDFQFAHPRDSAGTLVAVVGLRVHHNVIDIVQLYGEDDADAARIPGDEPDVLFPQTVIWRTSGRARDVIKQVLRLEDPVEIGTAAKGCWMPTHAGRSTWLAASA
ncbi:hypothetical protein [Saccharopolyspora erythraea]|uniref:hypothetical protein n=1 Tax=Saccharopolyspora erythraea TaxID=1836 RepID=UPI002012EBB6|nr:hypothetical protein [Saccharopolyspora erythraea]